VLDVELDGTARGQLPDGIVEERLLAVLAAGLRHLRDHEGERAGLLRGQ
jgi:hypothetical protein